MKPILLTLLLCGSCLAQDNWHYYTNSENDLIISNSWCITNNILLLPAKLSYCLETNWTTQTMEMPVLGPGEANDLVYRPTMYHQWGSVTSNTVAAISWKGSEVTTVLEKVPVTTLTRTVDANQIQFSPNGFINTISIK